MDSMVINMTLICSLAGKLHVLCMLACLPAVENIDRAVVES
jgi:hypothetical protein